MPFDEMDFEDEVDDDAVDEVDAWLAAHPGVGKPALTPELWEEMYEDARMGGYDPLGEDDDDDSE